MYVLKCNKDLIDRPDDYAQVNHIFLDSFEQALRIAQNKIKRRIKTGKYIPFFFKKEDALIGFSYVTYPRYDIAHIDFLAISRSHRGGGTGSEALKLLISRLEEKSVITLECEDKLVGFYRKFGFKLAPYLYSNYPVRLNFMIRPSKNILKVLRFADYSNVVASFNGIGANTASKKPIAFDRHGFSAIGARIMPNLDVNDKILLIR